MLTKNLCNLCVNNSTLIIGPEINRDLQLVPVNNSTLTIGQCK